MPGAGLSRRVHRNPEDPTDFFLYELYREEADYLAHHDSEHFRQVASEQAIRRLAE